MTLRGGVKHAFLRANGALNLSVPVKNKSKHNEQSLHDYSVANPLNTEQIKSFRQFIGDFYQKNGRTFPWRYADDPYHIVVSEVMLQQTQTSRVEQKYEQFIARFNNFEELATASLQEVLIAWQGLGYNRRAKLLQQLAIHVMQDFNGTLPADEEQLAELPGIGPATASSICAFAFNMPTLFIETNIRTVFIAHFFASEQEVHDRDILPLVEATLDKSSPREWYYALMDYGVFLKKQCNNKIATQSAHYVRQSPFEGSDRQIRSRILRTVLAANKITLHELLIAEIDAERTARIIDQLIKEGLLKQTGPTVSIGENK